MLRPNQNLHKISYTTSDYVQPDFYKFNGDSLKLVKFILKEVSTARKILDLGCGCGIIGIELSKVLNPSELHLVELQKDFSPFLLKNLKVLLHPGVVSRTFFTSFSEFHSSTKYDLIVSNPPYYLPGHGMLGPREERNKARCFQVDNWNILLKKVGEYLEVNGVFYFIIKNDPVLLKEIEQYSSSFKVQWHSDKQLMIARLTRLNIKGGE